MIATIQAISVIAAGLGFYLAIIGSAAIGGPLFATGIVVTAITSGL